MGFWTQHPEISKETHFLQFRQTILIELHKQHHYKLNEQKTELLSCVHSYTGASPGQKMWGGHACW